MSEHVYLKRRGPRVDLVFDRPDLHNALNLEMWQDIHRLVVEIGEDDEVRVLVLRGVGENAFASGSDINEFPSRRTGAENAAAYLAVVEGALLAIKSCPKPTIAEISGYCLGGGFILASFCDLRIGADNGRFGIPISRIGLTLGWEEMRQVLHVIGFNATRDILLTSRLFTPEEAHQVGYLNELVPLEELTERVDRRARAVANGSQMVHRVHKQMLAIFATDPGLKELSPAEEGLSLRAFDSQDFVEGVQAFLEKRKPDFSH